MDDSTVAELEQTTGQDVCQMLVNGDAACDVKCPEPTLPKNNYLDSQLFDMVMQPAASSSLFPMWASRMLFIFINIGGYQHPSKDVLTSFLSLAIEAW